MFVQRSSVIGKAPFTVPLLKKKSLKSPFPIFHPSWYLIAIFSCFKLKSGFPLKPGTLLNKTKPEFKSKGYTFVYVVLIATGNYMRLFD